MTSVGNRDVFIDAPRGRLFARYWKPEEGAVLQWPIILFHDSLGCVELWRDFPEKLASATGRVVIAYDRLGFGRSAPYPGILEFDFITREARDSFSAIYDHFQLTGFVALGHSVGGAMGAVCAGEFGSGCAALITEAAQAVVEERTLAGIREAAEAFAQSGQMGRLKKYHGDKAEWVLNSWVNIWLSERFRQWNLDRELARVQCPVLAIHGDRDEYGSLRQPERIRSHAGGPTEMAILDHCGHVPHREKQQAMVSLIKGFLKDLELD